MNDILQDTLAQLAKVRTAITAALALSVVAYGFLAFNLTLAGDDWTVIHDGTSQYAWVLSIGRWMHRLFWVLAYDNRFAPTFSLSILVVLLIFSAALTALATGARSNRAVLPFIALYAFNPILAEEFNFKNNHIDTGFGFLLCALSIRLTAGIIEQRAVLSTQRRISLTAFATLLLILATGCKQSFVPLWMASFAAVLLARLPASSIDHHDLAVGLIVLLAGVAGYAAISLTFVTLTGVEPVPMDSPYGAHLAITLEAYRNNGVRFWQYFSQYLFQEQHLIPVQVKLAFLPLLALYPVLLLRRLDTISARVLALCLLVALLVSPWLIGLVRVAPSYRYTGLIGLLPIYPVIIMQVQELVQSHWLRGYALAFSGFAGLSFLLFQNAAQLATYTSNQRDIATVLRIIGRIENHPDYASVADVPHSVYFIGYLDRQERALAPFGHYSHEPMAKSIVSCGVFNCQPGRLPALISLLEFPNPARRYLWLDGGQLEPKMAGLVCRKSMRAWPSQYAIAFQGQMILVYLGGAVPCKP